MGIKNNVCANSQRHIVCHFAAAPYSSRWHVHGPARVGGFGSQELGQYPSPSTSVPLQMQWHVLVTRCVQVDTPSLPSHRAISSISQPVSGRDPAKPPAHTLLPSGFRVTLLQPSAPVPLPLCFLNHASLPCPCSLLGPLPLSPCYPCIYVLPQSLCWLVGMTPNIPAHEQPAGLDPRQVL